jgi:hypothetical protein
MEREFCDFAVTIMDQSIVAVNYHTTHCGL